MEHTICIKESDNVEKALQIPRIDVIYSATSYILA